MIYAFLKVWANWVIRIFFRKIYTRGIAHVPKKKALLIGSNHPNGFIEPITMACLFPRPLHFLVRGDVFENPIQRYFLESTNQIPIFRFKDGFENLRKNNASIDISLDKLKQGESILIFVEGGTKSTKSVRPLQKGLARIAFQVLDKDPSLELDILPVGMNYLDNTNFRSESILSVGNTISANTYYRKYHDDVNKGIKMLNSELYDAIKKQVIHLDDLRDTNMLDKLLYVSKAHRSNSILPLVQDRGDVLTSDKTIATQLNALSTDQKSKLSNRLNEIVGHTDLKVWVDRYHDGSVWKSILLLVILALPALLGLIINAIPLFGGLALARKTARKSIFFMSMWLTGFALIGLLFYLIGIIVCLVIFGWKGLLLLLGIPLGSSASIWYDQYRKLRSHLSMGSKVGQETIIAVKSLASEFKINI